MFRSARWRGWVLADSDLFRHQSSRRLLVGCCMFHCALGERSLPLGVCLRFGRGTRPRVNIRVSDSCTAFTSLTCSKWPPPPTSSSWHSRSSMVCRARKTLPCQRNHLRLSRLWPTSGARSHRAAGRVHRGSGGGALVRALLKEAGVTLRARGRASASAKPVE